MFTRTICTAALAASAAHVSPAAVIALDGRVTPEPAINFATGTNLAAMRQRLTDLGHTVVTVTAYDAATLAGVDVLLTREATNNFDVFTQQMADDIAAFNASGGGVGFFADGGFGSNGLIASNNLVANALGANLVGNAILGNGTIVTGFASHPVTDGVTEWGLDFVRRVEALPGSIDLTADPASLDFAVARDGIGTAGNAFVMGDASWLNSGTTSDYQLNDLDNLQAFDNIIAYLVPAPGTAVLAGIAGLTALRRRR